MDPEKLLSELAGSADLQPFLQAVLPLAERDRLRGSDLIRTLHTYLATGGNVSEAADRLFLHRNSMSYRLDRVRELTGLDPRSPRARLVLQLGLLAMQGEEDEAQHP
jgi:purine catabolism regulator